MRQLPLLRLGGWWLPTGAAVAFAHEANWDQPGHAAAAAAAGQLARIFSPVVAIGWSFLLFERIYRDSDADRAMATSGSKEGPLVRGISSNVDHWCAP
jgi:hypothetical protein